MNNIYWIRHPLNKKWFDMWWYTNEPVRCSKNDIYYHTTVVPIRVTCIYKQVNWPSIDIMNINIMDKKKALSDIAEGQIFGRLSQSISQWLGLWDVYIKGSLYCGGWLSVQVWGKKSTSHWKGIGWPKLIYMRIENNLSCQVWDNRLTIETQIADRFNQYVGRNVTQHIVYQSLYIEAG